MAEKQLTTRKYTRHFVGIGKRYGMLLVVGGPRRDTQRRVTIWECQCDCGNTAAVLQNNLTGRSSESCGCQLWKGHPTHRDSLTAEYNTWGGMKQRCYNENEKAFKHYGGRGIVMCDSWLDSYEAFLADMGRRPSPDHSIDRIDNNGNYEPGNCRWATRAQQDRNKRNSRNLTIDGITKPLDEWASHSRA